MFTIAIAGNPNCGKTTLFNQLTGSKQKVGNWPGVTVEKKEGVCVHKGEMLTFVDLPGTYSLTVPSEERCIDEHIACQYLLSNRADVVVNILDAANLKRNLYLTLQLLDMNIPCVVALNMMDIARERQIHIDTNALSQLLGCPVIALVSTKKQGLNELKDILIQEKTFQKKPTFHYPQDIAQTINQLTQIINTNAPAVKNPQWAAVSFLEGDFSTKKMLENTDCNASLRAIVEALEKQREEEADIILADCRYEQINHIFSQCVKTATSLGKTVTDKIDSIVMHRWLGIPIFLFLMYLMFEFSMNVGTLLQPLFDISSTTVFIDGVNYLGNSWGLPAWITAIFAQGLGVGINTVVNFIPQIGLMFLFLAFLEDSGYMARAAFVMDRFMQWVGLPGKSFVPLIVGFGCNVPSIMATRTLENRRDRIVTAMMAPFMSCGARLAIFVVFVSAFFPHHGGAIIFSLYLLGIVMAMLTGLFLKKTFLKGDSAPFVQELPIYHLPNLKTIGFLTWNRLKMFVRRAGRMIIPICILIGSLNAIQLDGKVEPYGGEHSLLSVVGKTLTPVFQPMGLDKDNWPATVGLITGTLAKEVVVGTLNTLYSQGNDAPTNPEDFHLWAGLKASVTETLGGIKDIFSAQRMNPFTVNEADSEMSHVSLGNMQKAFITPMAAFAYLIFVLLYIPCVSTMAALSRELGRGWAVLSIFWSFDIAYFAAVFFYQLTNLTIAPFSACLWLSGIVIGHGILFSILRRESFQKNSFRIKGTAT